MVEIQKNNLTILQYMLCSIYECSNYFRRVLKWKYVNVVAVKHLVNVNAANNLRGLHGFDSVELGGRVQVGKIQP